MYVVLLNVRRTLRVVELVLELVLELVVKTTELLELVTKNKDCILGF